MTIINVSDMNSFFCEQIRESNTQSNVSNKKKKQTPLEPITLREKVFKGQKIGVIFEGEQKDLSDLCLKIFVNQKLKFVSPVGVFAIQQYQTPRIIRKGWFLTTIMVDKQRLIFKDQKELERFKGFITQLRDCTRVEEMFIDLCFSHLKKHLKKHQECTDTTE